MKLAFCLFKYFPYGGLQRDFLRIARLCHKRGHTVHVYTMHWQGDIEPGLKLHLIRTKGWQNHTRIRSFIDQVQVRIMAEGFDRVIGFNKIPNLDFYYAADVCFQARAQQKHGLLFCLLPRYRQYVQWEEAVFARGKPTKIMLISSLQQQAFTDFYQTEPERFHLLPPGIAKDRLPPSNVEAISISVRAIHQVPADHHLLLMVGSGFKTKGLDRAIRGLAALPLTLRERCHLFVIGQDNAAPFLKLARMLKVADKIKFLGGREDVRDFFLAADLLLHPAYHENTGTVILEALVAGLPVLTVEACGYAHFVNEANAGAVLPTPFDQDAFNQKLTMMLTAEEKSQWHENALHFGKVADIYSLPEKAVDLIESANISRKIESFSFEQMMALRGEVYRHQEGRLTQRVTLAERQYFIKQHFGVGWKEVVKNMLQLRWPVLSARNEWRVIEKLQSLNVLVPAVVAHGQRGLNPACKQSFVLLEELTPSISLEDLCKTWQQSPPAFNFKQQLIQEVARIARILHQAGINHRDFYICHFLLDVAQQNKENLKLYLIDLHRAMMRRKTPVRWVIKDLAGLYFSSKNIGLTQRDLLRFIKHYQQQPLRDIFKNSNIFWEKIKARGEQLYREH